MINTINWFHNEFGNKLIDTRDPVPDFLDKLSSGDQIKIKIQNHNDNILIQNDKKVQSITIPQTSSSESFDMSKIDRVLSVFSNRRSPNFPTLEQKYLLAKLKYIPVYTVVNNNNEVVTASPRDSKDFYSLKWIQEKISEVFFWSHDDGPVALNLFFMNKEDAASYLHEICKKEPREAEHSGLKITRVGLDVFYKLNRTSPPKIQSRLVADLKEVDSLLSKYVSMPSQLIHPKQKYSRVWFQGNPIYTIKFQKNTAGKTLSEYFFTTSQEKKVVFFSREDAIKAWKMFLLKRTNLHLNENPSIEVYNLESFLFDMENMNIREKPLEITFVPPYSSYLELKNENTRIIESIHNPIQENLFKAKLQLKNLQRFYKGIVWLFTSDTLPSEENSW
nr:hypothetical protein [Cryptomonas sp. NIES-3952]